MDKHGMQFDSCTYRTLRNRKRRKITCKLRRRLGFAWKCSCECLRIDKFHRSSGNTRDVINRLAFLAFLRDLLSHSVHHKKDPNFNKHRTPKFQDSRGNLRDAFAEMYRGNEYNFPLLRDLRVCMQNPQKCRTFNYRASFASERHVSHRSTIIVGSFFIAGGTSLPIITFNCRT